MSSKHAMDYPPSLEVLREENHLSISDKGGEDLFLCGVFMEDGQSFSLLALHVEPKHRGRGMASAMLLRLIEECTSSGVSCIGLDDMSDRARGPRNLYTKHGFTYRYETGPEMVLWLTKKAHAHTRGP